MADFGLGGIIASALAGAGAGKAADKAPSIPSPGGLTSLLGGGAGGLAGGLLTSMLAGGTDISAIAGQAVGGGVLGMVVTAVLGMVLKKK
ncbi:MAG: hypothetical protein V9F00_18445 [Nocardioides sp.]|jgi:hypothetical protein